MCYKILKQLKIICSIIYRESSKSENNVFDGSSFLVHLRSCRAVIKDSRGYNPPSSNYFSARSKAGQNATTDAYDRYTTETASNAYINVAFNNAQMRFDRMKKHIISIALKCLKVDNGGLNIKKLSLQNGSVGMLSRNMELDSSYAKYMNIFQLFRVSLIVNDYYRFRIKR